MKIIFIRHGKTQGNIQARFVGITDDPLCDEGRKELKNFTYPKVDKVYTSPLSRCRETAEIIYGGYDEVVEDLRECDFGIMENKTHNELLNNAEYVNWLKLMEDTNAQLYFPGGESKAQLVERCCKSVEKILKENISGNENASIAVVTHGGVIMTVMEALFYKKSQFYDWKLDNGQYIETEVISASEGIKIY